MCSIELPESFHIETNKIDMTSTETNQKTISCSINLCCNYPRINEKTEISNDKVITDFKYNLTANIDKLSTDVSGFDDSTISGTDIKDNYNKGFKIK